MHEGESKSARFIDTKSYHIDNVGFNRELEVKMLDGSEDDRQRIGIELAYTVAKTKFDVKNLAIGDLGNAARPLYTTDGMVLFESGMVDLRPLDATERQVAVLKRMSEIVSKLVLGLHYDSTAKKGYAIVSSIVDDSKSVRIDITEILWSA